MTGFVNLRHFYGRRAVRILAPVLVYLALITIIGFAAGITISIKELTACILSFRNFAPGHWWTAHFWSLSVEEQYYLCWPALFCVLPKGQRFVWTVALCVFAPVWRHLMTKLAAGTPMNLGRVDLIYDNLLAGAALAIAQRHYWFRSLLDGKQLQQWALFAATCVAFFLLSIYPPNFGKLGLIAIPTLKLICITIGIKLLIEGRCTLVQRVCALPPIVWLGRISYSLYLWQQIFCFGREGWLIQSAPFCLLASLLCATISYYLIECGAQRLRDRVWPQLKLESKRSGIPSGPVYG